MDATWIGLLVIWAVVEFVQFLRKRPFPQRMRVGAYWGIGFAALAALGSASREVNTWKFLAVSLAIYGTGALLICGVRIVLAKGWARVKAARCATRSELIPIINRGVLLHSKPLTSSEQGKLLIFSLLLCPSVVFLVGVVPTIFLAFGIFMMKKNQDFSSIETAVKQFKGYTWIALIGFSLGAIYWGYEFFTREDRWRSDGEVFALFTVFTTICAAYLLAVHFLFLKPLRNHQNWIVANGIFSSAPKSFMDQSASLDIDIIKGERLKNYSVADELLKWAKLKEDGHISEQEFNEARTKLLRKA